MRGGNFVQHTAAPCMGPWKLTVTERSIPDDGNAMFLAPWEHEVLDGPLLKVIKNLIANADALAHYLPGLLQVRNIKVTYPPREDLPLGYQLIEGRECLL
jgi:hypothetical protein